MDNSGSTAKINIPTSRLAFIVGVVLMCLLILARNVLKIGVPVILILIVATFIATFGTKTEIVALAICCIPFGGAFQYKYAILICILVYLVKYGHEIKIIWAVIPVLLMLVWEVLHAIGYAFSFVEYLRSFTEILLCLTLLLVSKKDIDYWFVIKALSISTLFILSAMFFNLFRESGYDIAAIFEGNYRFGASDEAITSYGLNYNANQLGLMCNICTTCLLQKVIAKEHSTFDIVLIVLITMFGIMTMSRSFILNLAIMVILFIFARKEDFAKKLKTLFYVVIIFALVFLLANWIMPSVVDRFIKRFTETDDITNGRTDLLAFYNRHLLSNAKYSLFGLGGQDIAIKMLSIYGYEVNVPHNGIQEILVVWGIPGLLMFVVFIIATISSAKQINKSSLSAYLVLILVFVFSLSGHIITSGTVLLAICLGYLSLCLIKKE